MESPVDLGIRAGEGLIPVKDKYYCSLRIRAFVYLLLLPYVVAHHSDGLCAREAREAGHLNMTPKVDLEMDWSNPERLDTPIGNHLA